MTILEIAQLSPEERLTLIERLWDSLDQDAVPVRQTVLEELERRWQSADADLAESVPWETVSAELGLSRR
jgi:putative addiction module component (TIGR02574 family)